MLGLRQLSIDNKAHPALHLENLWLGRPRDPESRQLLRLVTHQKSAAPGDWTRVAGVVGKHANHYTTKSPNSY